MPQYKSVTFTIDRAGMGWRWTAELTKPKSGFESNAAVATYRAISAIAKARKREASARHFLGATSASSRGSAESGSLGLGM